MLQSNYIKKPHINKSNDKTTIKKQNISHGLRNEEGNDKIEVR